MGIDTSDFTLKDILDFLEKEKELTYKNLIFSIYPRMAAFGTLFILSLITSVTTPELEEWTIIGMIFSACYIVVGIVGSWKANIRVMKIRGMEIQILSGKIKSVETAMVGIKQIMPENKFA